MATQETQPQTSEPSEKQAEDQKKTDARTADNKNQKPGSGQDKPKNRRVWFLFILILIVVFGLFFIIGLVPRLHRRPQLRAAAKAQQDLTPTVNVVGAKQAPAFDLITLPGNIQAIQQTAITARASGYIKRWLVDIGDHVRAGQTLAVISTPDVDQQVAQARAQASASLAALAQARANLANQQAVLSQDRAALSRSQATLQQSRTDLARAKASEAQAEETSAQQAAQVVQAQANLNLAHVTAQRYQNLLADGAIDQQTTDQAVAAYQADLANVQALQSAQRASQANVAAFKDAVLSSQSNVKAYAADIRSSRATVTGAKATVLSYEANIVAAGENVRANQANLARNAVLQSFKSVTAPFAGVITARNVDNGALISAGGSVSGNGTDSATIGNGSVGSTSQGNSASGSATGSASAPASTSAANSGGGTATSLFSLAQTNILRIYVSVPQNEAVLIRPNQSAQILVRELPKKPFLGRIARTSASLDAASRTLVTEIDVNNPQGLLVPGMFAQVRLRVPHPNGALLIPDSALLTNAGGTQVLIVTKDGKLHYQPISVGRDFGAVIEVVSGLTPNAQVVTNPNDSLHEGQSVHAASAPPPAQGG